MAPTNTHADRGLGVDGELPPQGEGGDDDAPASGGRNAVSQRLRKRIEEGFGWIRLTGGLAKTRHRGLDRVGWMFTLIAAA